MKDKENKDIFWTVAGKEFDERLRILTSPYEQVVWQYLQRYIIRGKGLSPLWIICYEIKEASGVLAASITIDKMVKDLNISKATVIRTLKSLEEKKVIIRYKSKTGILNNTNIYIMGFMNNQQEINDNIFLKERYFTSKNNMIDIDCKDIIALFDEQIRIGKTIKKNSDKILEIQRKIFVE